MIPLSQKTTVWLSPLQATSSAAFHRLHSLSARADLCHDFTASSLTPETYVQGTLTAPLQ